MEYYHCSFQKEAVTLFDHMQQTDLQPDQFTIASVLSACARIKALEQGMTIHKTIMDGGILSNVVVETALVNMYSKCRRVDTVRELFDKMTFKNGVSWNAMISGYTKNGYFGKALETFTQMQLAGEKPDSVTFASILPTCAEMRALKQGMAIHQRIEDGGISSDVVLATASVDMYAKCGSIDKARELFDRTPQRNVLSWTAMIAGYVQNGFVEKDRELFDKMPQRNVVSWSTMVSAYAQNGFIEARELFDRTPQRNVVSWSAMAAGYAQNGFIEKARELFDRMPQRNVVSWSAMVAGYEQNGFFEKALESFKQMQQAGVKPDSTTYACVLPACAKTGALKQGMNIHKSMKDSGNLSDVVATALIDMYAKCGSVGKARELFDKMRKKDVLSWTAMIAGYAQNGFAEKALETFKQMQLAVVKPNSVTFVSILPACGKMGALEHGMDIHQSIMDMGNLSDVVVATVLVDMYAKCGSIYKACELFEKMPNKNVISWTAIIAGYAQNGYVEKALGTFKKMQVAGGMSNSTAFACVLFAFSHAGLVDEGCIYFNCMSESYCMMPTIDHYVCMVDLLGRAGYLDDTLNFIIKMPIKPVMVVWMCFLGACRLHMNIGLGVFTATLLFYLDPENAATYVLLLNIYAEVGRWSEVEMIRRLMKERRIKKTPGCSWIDRQEMFHIFLS